MELAVGCRVRLHGLQSSAGAQFNDLSGTITSYVTEMDRWHVVLDGCEEAKLFKADNLTRLDVDTSSGAHGAGEDARKGSGGHVGYGSASRYEGRPPASGLAADETRRGRASRPRARSCGPRASRADEQRDPSVGRLRGILEDWQNAHAQWQAAYAVLGERCMLLETENRQLREVLEVVENGPDMSARFVARLARQNWRLGHEASSRATVVDPPSDREVPAPAVEAPAAEGEGDEPADAGSDRRPAGVKRLPLDRCVCKPDADASNVPNLGEESFSAGTSEGDEKPGSGRESQASSASSQRLPARIDEFRKPGKSLEEAMLDEVRERQDKNDVDDNLFHPNHDERRRWTPEGKAERKNAHRRRDSERRENERRADEERRIYQPNGQPRGRNSSSPKEKESAWAVGAGMALSVVTLGLVATFALGRLFAFQKGDDFEL